MSELHLLKVPESQHEYMKRTRKFGGYINKEILSDFTPGLDCRTGDMVINKFMLRYYVVR